MFHLEKNLLWSHFITNHFYITQETNTVTKKREESYFTEPGQCGSFFE